MRDERTIKRINQMLLATMKTKTSKEPKYRKELEHFGIHLVSDPDISTYGYWGVTVYPESMHRTLVISQDCRGARALFDPFTRIAGRDQIEKVDLWNLLNLHWERIIPWDEKYPMTATQRYKVIQSQIHSNEIVIKELTEKIEKLQYQLDSSRNGRKILEEKKERIMREIKRK